MNAPTIIESLSVPNSNMGVLAAEEGINR